MQLTVANRITIVRILMVPVFVVALLRYIQVGEEFYRWAAFATFTLAALGDGVDGYVARRFNQRTDLGALLDPVADKLLLVFGLVVLTLDTRSRLDRIPLWLTGTVVCRDVILLLLLALVSQHVGRATVRPRWTGKVATVLQMSCVIWALLKMDPTRLDDLALVATFATAVSGVQYTIDGIRLLRSQGRPPPGPSAAGG